MGLHASKPGLLSLPHGPQPARSPPLHSFTGSWDPPPLAPPPPTYTPAARLRRSLAAPGNLARHASCRTPEIVRMPTTSGAGAEAERPRPSRYESQKRRDWQTFTRYLSLRRPPLELRQCSGAHAVEFLRHLDRYGKTRVHEPPCPSYGGGASSLAPEAEPCQCPRRQAWGSLDALVGRLRAAFDERHGGGAARATTTTTTTTAVQVQQQQPENAGAGENNPFAARAVTLYLRDVRDEQARARGISYCRKKKTGSNKEKGSIPAGEGVSG
ncbi:hypothetical protein HU200_028042 [Digitaria exilis]|uniref:ALOG domain-containing protein n=1 Tax=Digitaria exilis TaxID=1010633 RepID=A0A835EUA2_9POAL|nr:hypothetical protein HU200_028042 [Digitaria exilis]